MSTARKPGRPREAAPSEIVRVALELFEARGVDQVTMDEVAKAASVSRRTLFRLFPSKADLVWDGIADFLQLTKVKLGANQKRRYSLHQFVEEVLMPGVAALDDASVATLTRRRLRLVAASPGLFNHPALLELQQVLSATIASKVDHGRAPAELVARSVVSVGFAAILWWAQDEGGTSAVEAMRAAYAAVASVQTKATV